MDTDRAVMGLLDEAAVSYAVVLTKTDELKKGELASVAAAVESEAGKHTAAYPAIFATSAHGKDGLDALKEHLAALAAS
jgi:GTP-binding protein